LRTPLTWRAAFAHARVSFWLLDDAKVGAGDAVALEQVVQRRTSDMASDMAS